jgi:hypothetical protein
MRGLERGDGAQRRVSCAGIHCDLRAALRALVRLAPWNPEVCAS